MALAASSTSELDVNKYANWSFNAIMMAQNKSPITIDCITDTWVANFAPFPFPAPSSFATLTLLCQHPIFLSLFSVLHIYKQSSLQPFIYSLNCFSSTVSFFLTFLFYVIFRCCFYSNQTVESICFVQPSSSCIVFFFFKSAK